MKIDKKKQLRGESLAVLTEELNGKIKKLMEARLELGRGKLKNTALIRELKKDIAIIKTYIVIAESDKKGKLKRRKK